jgi:hypothetical protein
MSGVTTTAKSLKGRDALGIWFHIAAIDLPPKERQLRLKDVLCNIYEAALLSYSTLKAWRRFTAPGTYG